MGNQYIPEADMLHLGRSRNTNEEMAQRVSGPGPAYVVHGPGTPVSSNGVSAIEQLVDLLENTLLSQQEKVDRLQARLHLPPIYAVPTAATIDTVTAAPEHRLGYIVQRLEDIGRGMEKVCGHLEIYSDRLA